MIQDVATFYLDTNVYISLNYLSSNKIHEVWELFNAYKYTRQNHFALTTP